jgi:hypothetical protein
MREMRQSNKDLTMREMRQSNKERDGTAVPEAQGW